MRKTLLKARNHFGDFVWLMLVSLAIGLLPQWSLAQPVATGPGPSGNYLLRKAEALQASGQLDAAATAYNQATAAFRRTDDADGQQRALTELATLEEKRADQLLADIAAPPRPAAAGAGHFTASVARPALAPRPAGAAALPRAGKMVGGKPLGLFFMTRYSMAWHSLEKASFYFTPAGQVYRNPTDFTPAALGSLAPADRGTYSVAGGQMTWQWADGNKTQAKLEGPSSGAFNFDTGIFVGMAPFASVRQLVGSFEGGNSVSSGSGSASAVSGLTFRPDGTYSGGRATSFSTNTTESNAHVGGSGEAAGRWTLAGWVLTLTDTAGRTSRGVAYPIETDDKTGQVRRFYFNNVAYKRL